MAREIEIEFKNIVQKDEFERLKAVFHIEQQAFHLQMNHYFDTPSFSVKEKGAALRIREKNGSLTLTLKQPHPDGLLETHQKLAQQQAEQLQNSGKMPDGDVKQALHSLNVTGEQIQYLGKLATLRAETEYKGGTLVFDESTYLEKTDYEIEYETDSAEQGEKAFHDLMKDHGIPLRDTRNKIRRFFDEKQKAEKTGDEHEN
ncbi:CYTH domain-containing protein [Bacillus marinisedimentorum]|uniref:CYTH domain-containing protein n=1 Tax=Bacillus marinisedimentorum TaxID=1821260 RepID=UPI000872E43B|nr:CYTH domain-containing protein [Bacillus marinisedimentorum]